MGVEPWTESGLWSQEQTDLLIELYPTDIPMSILSKRVGRKPSSIQKKAQEIGVKRSKKVYLSGHPFLKPPKEELLQLFSTTGNVKGVANFYGVDHGVVVRWLDYYEIDRTQWYKTKNNANLEITTDLVYILAVLWGDGNGGYLYNHVNNKYDIAFRSKDKKFADEVFEAFKRISLSPSMSIVDYSGKEYWVNRNPQYAVYASSKKFVQWFREVNYDKLREIVLSSKSTAIAFIKGFYESEGSLHRKDWYINIYNTNKRLLEICIDALKLIGFETSLRGPYYCDTYRKGKYILYVRKKESNKTTDRFLTVINPCIKRGEKRR